VGETRVHHVRGCNGDGVDREMGEPAGGVVSEKGDREVVGANYGATSTRSFA
jgi:hypothetical protein